MDNGKTAAEITSDAMVMGAMWALCKFSLLVSQQNHSDLFHTALADALKRCYQKKGIVWEQKRSKSAKAKVDVLFAKESRQLPEQTIHKICGAMKGLVYGAEQVSTTHIGNFRCT